MNKVFRLIKQDIKDSKSTLLATVIITALLGALWGGFFPVIKENADLLKGLVEQGGLGNIFVGSGDVSTLDFADYSVYIAMEYFSFFWAVVYAPFLIAWGIKHASEAEKGVLALYLAQPISRLELSISQLGSLFLKTLFSATGAMISVYLPSLFFEGAEVNETAWIKFGLMLFLFMLFISYSAYFFSITLMSKTKGLAITALIVGGGYMVDIIVKLIQGNQDIEFVQNIKYLSVWHYFGDPIKQLQTGDIYNEGFLFFLIVVILIAITTPFIFRRKDLVNG